MAANWYLNRQGIKTGPFTVEDLRKQGITPDTIVWSEASYQWMLASEIPELRPAFKATPPPLHGEGSPGTCHGGSTPPPVPDDIPIRKYYRPPHRLFVRYCLIAIVAGLVFLRFFTPFFASIFSSYIWARMSLVVSGIVLLTGTGLSFFYKEKFYKKWILSVCIILAAGNLILMKILFGEYFSYHGGYAIKEYYEGDKVVTHVDNDDPRGYRVDYLVPYAINRLGIKVQVDGFTCDILDHFPTEDEGYIIPSDIHAPVPAEAVVPVEVTASE